MVDLSPGPRTHRKQTSLELHHAHAEAVQHHQILSIAKILFILSIEANSCVQLTAYWIAFGPHGPRAQDPPGTNARIFWGVFAGVAASVAIFGAIRLAAKPAPHTMTKEWQEASNEILKVSPRCPPSTCTSQQTNPTCAYRSKRPTPSRVSPPKATRAPARSSLPPRALRCKDTEKQQGGDEGSRRPKKRRIRNTPSPTTSAHHDDKKRASREASLPLTTNQLFSLCNRIYAKAPKYASGERFGVGFDGWCKYCTTTIDPKSCIDLFIVTSDVHVHRVIWLCASYTSSHPYHQMINR